MTRRFLSLPLVVAPLLALPMEVSAQVSPGLHVVRASDSFGGVMGVGGSLRLSPPLVPVDLFFAGEYFFPDCDACSFWGASADVHFALPASMLTPYATVGPLLRNTDESDTSVRTGGLGLGAGLDLDRLAVRAYAEGRYELMDGSGDQWVFRLGIRF